MKKKTRRNNKAQGNDARIPFRRHELEKLGMKITATVLAAPELPDEEDHTATRTTLRDLRRRYSQTVKLSEDR